MDTSPASASASFWVGLGGDDFDGGGWLAQAGIQGTICMTCGPAATVQYQMWYEDILNTSSKHGPYYLDASTYKVNAGDSIEVIVDSDNDFAGQIYFYIGDVNTNSYFGMPFPWSLPNGSTAEWVVERGFELDQFDTPGICPSGIPGENCVSFTNDYVVRNGSTIWINALPTNAIVMNPNGTQDAFPGPIHNTGSAAFFNTYWQHNN